MKTRHFYILIGVTLLLTGAGLVFTMSQPREGGGQTQFMLSDSARKELNTTLDRNKVIVGSMPGHPKSKEVLDEVVSILAFEFGVEPDKALRLAAEFFRDSNLGLYALRSYLDDSELSFSLDSQVEGDLEDAETYCHWICESYPDSRISSMAFDFLLPKQKNRRAFCEEFIEAEGNTKLGVFAKLRHAEILMESGDDGQAALSLVQIWYAEPKRGAQIVQRLQRIWESHGDWITPTLIHPAFFERPDLLPVLSQLEGFLEAAKQNDSNPARVFWENGMESTSTTPENLSEMYVARALLLLAKRQSDNGSLDLALDTLREATERLEERGLEDPEALELLAAISVFPLPGPDTPEADEDVVEMLRLRQEITTLKGRALEKFGRRAAQSRPNTRAYYAYFFAGDQLRGFNADAAIEQLESEAFQDGVDPWLRTKLAIYLAEIADEEMNAPKRAAELFSKLAEHSTKTANRADLLLNSGRYYFEGELYAEAKIQFKSVLDFPASEQQRAVAEFLLAFCELNQENSQAADLLLKFASEYHDSDMAPHALFLLANMRMGELEYSEARKIFRRLVETYPGSDYAGRASDYLSRLKGISEQ